MLQPHDWNSNACFLKWSPLFVFRASLVAYRLLSTPSTPIWWTAQITFDPSWIKDVLLCAAVYSQHSLLPDFNDKHIVLLSYHHFCGSQELREDVIMLHALYPPTKSLSQPPDVIFIVGISHGGVSLIWIIISIRTTITSVHMGKFSPCFSPKFPGIHILHILQYPILLKSETDQKQDASPCCIVWKFQEPHLSLKAKKNASLTRKCSSGISKCVYFITNT